ncbi:MAG: hypothetical protein P8107_13840 [Spirochaetia bacterium]|jgi:hypothetical protein
MSTIKDLNLVISETKNGLLRVKARNSAVWKYSRADGRHKIDIFYYKDNIYIVESKGIAYQEGCSLAFDFIIDTVEKEGSKVCCLLDNTLLSSIDWSFKLLFLKFPLANECFKKIATYGDNLYVQSFAKIYQYTFGRKFQIRAFKEKTLALHWLDG